MSDCEWSDNDLVEPEAYYENQSGNAPTLSGVKTKSIILSLIESEEQLQKTKLVQRQQRIQQINIQEEDQKVFQKESSEVDYHFKQVAMIAKSKVLPDYILIEVIPFIAGDDAIYYNNMFWTETKYLQKVFFNYNNPRYDILYTNLYEAIINMKFPVSSKTQTISSEDEFERRKSLVNKEKSENMIIKLRKLQL